ncbi:hypothetical protein D3C72_952830 [compost metagenome]
MFEVFIKDFMFGTRHAVVSATEFKGIIDDWLDGKDLNIDDHTIANKHIESVSLRYKE